MLWRQLFATQAIEYHHRALDACITELLQAGQRRGKGFRLVHQAQHLIIARFATDVSHFQAGIVQFFEFVHRFVFHIAGQTIARHPVHRRQMGANGLQNGEQTLGRQHHRIAIGQKHPFNGVLPRGALQESLDFFLWKRAKFLLRLRVHLTKRAFVPRAAIGHRQNQRLGFAGRAENGFYVHGVCLNLR